MISPFATLFLNDVVTAFGRDPGFGLFVMDARREPAFERTWTPGAGGSFGQFVPFQPMTTTASTLMPIESSAAFRTNIGLANLAAPAGQFRVKIHDASGAVIGTTEFALEALQLVQIPIQQIVGSRVLRGGWAEVAGSGPLLFYASVVDNASGDAVHIPAQ